MIPESMLPVVLERFFPVIEGPDDLDRVLGLVDARGIEFCAALRTDPVMVAEVARRGFLPMSESFSGHELLLVKVHEQRCLLHAKELHVSRSTVRHARGLTLRIDSDFDRCLDGVVTHHPDRWLTDRLCDAMRSLHREPVAGVAMHSVEVYDGDLLVAGEVGYTCGVVYTSMSGYHARSGSGSVQLASLGAVLDEAGYRYWDLGMVIDYKLDLGATVYPRTAFLERYRAAAGLASPQLPREAACEALVRRARSGYSSVG